MNPSKIGAVVPMLVLLFVTVFVKPVEAQSISSGTVDGTVLDPTGAAVAGAGVEIRNPLTGYRQAVTTDAKGTFHLSNIPFNNYHMEVSRHGFAVTSQDVNVRSTVPINVKLSMAIEGVEEAITVESSGADLVETATFAHVDVDRSALRRLPVAAPATGLSDAIVLSSPGVVADSNGFFHPLGDHAQTSFSIDGQPITDQQSKAFSTQMPVNAVQSLEITTGTPNAEFGGKTSLVVNTTTRSGLGLLRPKGSFQMNYGSFGTPSIDADIGLGNDKVGWFTAVNGLRSGRFLDTPEFAAIHARGSTASVFNRFDFRPSSRDTLHVNALFARNSFQQPNTLDQPNQDQGQETTTFNIAVGYQRVLGPSALLTVSPFVRQDRVIYTPSPDPADDTPASVSQERHLTNWGMRGDVSYVTGTHNLKIGGQMVQTRLLENFRLGITDFGFNAVCVDSGGAPQALPSVTSPADCAGLGFDPNPNFNEDLAAMDLTRGGVPFAFSSNGNIDEFALYVQDAITVGRLSLNPGLRIDHYDGVVKSTAAEPRFGAALRLGGGTVLRAGYARTLETPYNENLLVATSPAASGLVTAFSEEGGAPVATGIRNQYNVGAQHAISRYVQIDADYFWKFTDNAYDFGVLFNTPVTFPISWPKSRIDGLSFRVSSTLIHGFQWYTTIGHSRARFRKSDGSVFRIDHDQKLQQTTNLRYQRKGGGPWVSWTWRYDSGLVAGDVPTVADALALTPAEQAAIGFHCGSQVATPDAGISECASGGGATRLRIPAEGTADDALNPPRIAPRHLFDIGFGDDNVFRTKDGTRFTLRFGISNLTNKIALYNFHSTFSGTHFVAPRSLTASIGMEF